MKNSETITEKENEEIRTKDSHLNLQFPKLQSMVSPKNKRESIQE